MLTAFRLVPKTEGMPYLPFGADSLQSWVDSPEPLSEKTLRYLLQYAIDEIAFIRQGGYKNEP
jgi:hypothetical protein